MCRTVANNSRFLLFTSSTSPSLPDHPSPYTDDDSFEGGTSTVNVCLDFLHLLTGSSLEALLPDPGLGSYSHRSHKTLVLLVATTSTLPYTPSILLCLIPTQPPTV